MRFGIHNSSWLDRPDPAEAFEAVKAKAQWAENHGFVWFSVMGHTIQIPRVGPPDEPVLEGWTVLSGLAAVTSRIRLATLATAVGYRNPAHLAKIAASVDLISGGRLTLHRGRILRGGVQAVRLGVRAAAGDPHPADGGSGAAHSEDVDRAAHDLPRAVFPRRGGACNFVGSDVAEVRHKLAVLRGHCDTVGRDYATIGKTHVQQWLLARNAAAVAAKREGQAARGPVGGFLGTVSEAIDLIGQYQDAGVDLLIQSDRRNDAETRELLVSEVMPHFA